MGKQKNPNKSIESNEVAGLRRQLMISLKFHHYETLQKLPLELAIRAMTEAWSAVQPEDISSHCSGASTAIIPHEEAAKAIRKSQYFSG